jgi:hypothetical protein
MAMIQSRNQTSHTYNEEIAAAIAKAILSLYMPEFEIFLRQFTELEKEEPRRAIMTFRTRR